MLRFLAVEVRVDFLREHATRFKRGCRSLFLDGGEGLLCHPLSVFDVGVELSSVGGHSYGCLCNHDLLRDVRNSTGPGSETPPRAQARLPVKPTPVSKGESRTTVDFAM
jgi:hypothetical protein